jgi:adenine-specific DNA methylase
VFGGTGVVSHLFKNANKQVTYNDNLTFNWNIGLALIQNADTRLSAQDVELILEARSDVTYPDFIQRTFANIYFTDEENAWLDHVTYNIDHFVENPTKQALARFALFQACIIKRPYNLFHRANLYMRHAKVERSFGNKSTWDTPFEVHFQTFVQEANRAVFDNGRDNRALNLDALSTPTGCDLVYLDPPYLNIKGVGVDYRDFYHFLEGLTYYDDWDSRIDLNSKHRRLMPKISPWTQPKMILDAFEKVISRHRDSILVVSYRDDGIPTKSELRDLLSAYKREVREASQGQKYALSIQESHESLYIAI